MIISAAEKYGDPEVVRATHVWIAGEKEKRRQWEQGVIQGIVERSGFRPRLEVLAEIDEFVDESSIVSLREGYQYALSLT